MVVVWEDLKPRGDRAGAVRRAPAPPALIEVVQPGGELDGLATVVPGVTRLSPGDEVVLLLTATPWGLQPIGYSLGTFFVAPGERLRPAWRGHLSASPATSLSMDALRGVQP